MQGDCSNPSVFELYLLVDKTQLDVWIHALCQNDQRMCCRPCRSSSAKKRLAVPFRAADLPSPRSEFSQADVAMVYTHLSYYLDGLSNAEFRQAVLMLLGRGPSEQAYQFNRWLAQGRASGSQDTRGE